MRSTIGSDPSEHIADPELPEEVQPAHVPFRKIFFSIPEGYWDMSNEQKDAWASEVATVLEVLTVDE
jgi:hypothetical protein